MNLMVRVWRRNRIVKEFHNLESRASICDGRGEPSSTNQFTSGL